MGIATKTVILLRHGDYYQLKDTPSAHQPFGLNDRGRQQAEDGLTLIRQMAKLHDWSFCPAVHSSNLLRAWETAQIICNGLSGTDYVAGFDDLAERGLGSAANLTVQQIEQILEADPRYHAPPKDWKSNSYYRLPLQGAESLMNAGKRVATHLKELEGPGVQIIVGHGASIRHAAHLLGVLSFEDIAKYSMFHAHPVVLERRADESWHHIGGDWKVRAPKEDYKD